MDLIKKALELCYEIEKLPASEQQTKLSVMASSLYQDLSKTIQEIKETDSILKIHCEILR
jgi:hypothetical protein